MMPRAIWKRILDASKSEALLAVDLYNRPKQHRRVEAFFVHMHLAWQLLLHARFHRDDVDYFYRKPGSNHFVRVDGEPKTWELAKCVRERWESEEHPVRKNLELTISLRNKIEHRFTRQAEAIEIATSGYAQATVLNYESELVSTFGQKHSLADKLRFPVFIGTFTHASAERMKNAREELPANVSSFLNEFQSELDDTVREDMRYEFRVVLVQQIGPKTEADIALNFVREDDLTESQKETMAEIGRKGTLLVREQRRPVASHGMHRPHEVVEAVKRQIPFDFNMHDFVQCWKRLEVRPPTNSSHPDRTIEQYCVYSEPYDAYVYIDAFVEKIVREAQTAEGFRELTGKQPTLSAADDG